MISLVIDTCVSNLYIGIVKDDCLLAFYNKHVEKDLSGIIFNVLDDVIKEAKVNKLEIDNIFIAQGPGSFTGVRIGVAIAKTYAWALGKRIVPFSSLEFMCSGYEEDCISLIDARRGYVFTGEYDSHLDSITADKYTSLESVLGKNAKYVSFDSFDNVEVNLPKYDAVKIVKKHINEDGVNPHQLNPIYLKMTEAEEKLINND